MCLSQRSRLRDALCSVGLVGKTLIPASPEFRPGLIMTWRWRSIDFLLNAPFNRRLPEIPVVRYRMQPAAAISSIFRDATAGGKEKQRDAEQTGERDAHEI